jgi:hypothetical protein
MYLDGEELGEPFDARRPNVAAGPVLSFGPMHLDAGSHRLKVRTLEGDSENPWISLRAVKFASDPADVVVEVPEKNPELVATFRPDINVPWGAAAHPDGEHIMISGNPGYGHIGGGIGIYNLQTEETQLLTHEDLIENHSVRTMTALPNGDVVCGTSVAGGHGTSAVAKDAVICLLDWESKSVEWIEIPVEGLSEIRKIVGGQDDIVYCLGTNGLLFSYDLQARAIVHSADLSEYGNVPVNPMQCDDSGRLNIVMSGAVLTAQPKDDGLAVTKICDAPGAINTGIGVNDGGIYFAVGSHLWSAGTE